MNTLLKEVYEPESYAHDVIANEIITGFLDIPGVREIIVQRVHELGGDLKYYQNDWGIERLEDLPFMYVWHKIMNEGETE